METCSAKVKIYGQEYTIAGYKTEDEIRQSAEYVDEIMHFIGKNSNLGSSTSVAVLTAVNIAEQMLSEKRKVSELSEKNEQLKNDAKRYIDLWDEAKKNLVKCRAEREELKIRVDEDERFRALESKYKEIEANFFELQNENIKLKSRLEEAEKEK